MRDITTKLPHAEPQGFLEVLLLVEDTFSAKKNNTELATLIHTFSGKGVPENLLTDQLLHSQSRPLLFPLAHVVTADQHSKGTLGTYPFPTDAADLSATSQLRFSKLEVVATTSSGRPSDSFSPTGCWCYNFKLQTTRHFPPSWKSVLQLQVADRQTASPKLEVGATSSSCRLPDTQARQQLSHKRHVSAHGMYSLSATMLCNFPCTTCTSQAQPVLCFKGLQQTPLRPDNCSAREVFSLNHHRGVICNPNPVWSSIPEDTPT